MFKTFYAPTNRDKLSEVCLVQGEEESGKSQVWGQLQVFGTDSRSVLLCSAQLVRVQVAEYVVFPPLNGIWS